MQQIILLLLWLGCLTLANVWGQTLSPGKVLGQYQQFIWNDQHGLPQNTVNAILRTRDGYLWIGTVEGVARFDGVSFSVFDTANTKELRHNGITALVEDQSGNLWISTHGGGVTRFRDGQFTWLPGLADDHVSSMIEDRAGNLWIGTEGGGLHRLRDGRLTSFSTRDGLPSNQIYALAEDPDGGVWAGTDKGVARLREGQVTALTTRHGLGHNFVRSLCRDRAGNLWAGSDEGTVSRWRDGRFTVFGQRQGLPHGPIWRIYEDRDSNVWVGSLGGGLWRFDKDRFVIYTERDGLPENRINALYQDPDGDLWLGTSVSGLAHLRQGRFTVLAAQDGLAGDLASAIYEDRAGNLWLGTSAGLSRLREGKLTTWTVKDGLPSNSIGALCEDRHGDLWVGTGNGMAQFKNGRFHTWTTRDGLSGNSIRGLLADRAGNLWAGTAGKGLNRLRDGHFTIFTAQDGLAKDDVVCLFEDRAGALWIGTATGGMSCYKDGRFTTWTTRDGLASNHVLSFYEDRAGALWIGTHGGGLNRFKNGKFSTITVDNGLYDNLAFQILEDDGGDLWMACNRGVYRASLRELNEVADGRLSAVNCFVYGVADGMLSRECNGASPAGWRTRDGRVWFPTTKGAVVVEPRQRNLQRSLVAIEQVRLDRLPLPSGQPLRIGPGQANLEIQYTGLNWNRPQQIKFKYQLLGLDQGWVEAGMRRTAYYPHLPPGSYTFSVIADNGEGVWNEEGKSLRITVLPPFYRTWWFLMLMGFGAGGLVIAAWKLRLAQFKRAQAAQQAFSRQLIASQESERKRIAAELHDSLGQRLVVIKNLALMFLQAPHGSNQSDGQGNGQGRQQIESLSAETSQAIGEVKEISYNLRPYQLDRIGLTKAVEAVVRTAAAASEIAFTCSVDNIDDVFPKESEINFYRIVQESVNNILKHSQATEASVMIQCGGQRLRLLIRDNGQGFAPGAPSVDWRKGGFGLVGIGERARLLGGEPVIHSAPGQGTTVSVEIDWGKKASYQTTGD